MPLLLWLGVLLLAAAAALLQSLLWPRWPQAELPPGFGNGLRLGDTPLRLVAQQPGRRGPDLAFSATLVLRPEHASAGPPAGGATPVPAGDSAAALGSGSATGLGAAGRAQHLPRVRELRLVRVQTRHRSDLAVPRLTRDRPDLRLAGARSRRISPSLSLAEGRLNGELALQTCLTGPAEGGYSEAELSRLRDHSPAGGWARLRHWLGLADNREFNCLLVTLVLEPMPRH